jgi:lipoprotein-anchoring transpeptidase ErfK/SrfK
LPNAGAIVHAKRAAFVHAVSENAGRRGFDAIGAGAAVAYDRNRISRPGRHGCRFRGVAMPDINRRAFLSIAAGAAAGLGLSACTTTAQQSSSSLAVASLPPPDGAPSPLYSATQLPPYELMYAAVDTEPFPVPAIKLSKIDPAFLRTVVPNPTGEPAGTIVVDPQAHYLYLVQDNGQAIRYGVGVGKQGFAWSGEAVIKFKREWPDWYPPKEMIERRPDLLPQLTELQSGIGMAGGPRTPLGVRAMYLWQGNKDTLFRIHGTTEPWSIGTSVSSGCIRMINQDVLDLYARTPLETRVVVVGTDMA